MDELGSTAARSGRAESRLQPPEVSDDGELRRWLAAPEFVDAADRLRRLGGDEELMLRLALSRFEGREWDRTAEEFAVYALAVLRAWIRTGTIFEKVHFRTKVRLAHPHEEWLRDQHVVSDLVHLTIGNALQRFRVVLMEGRWRADGGASLNTYFINQCLFQILNVYRDAWRGERDRRLREVTVSPEDVDLAPARITTAAAGDSAISRLGLEDLLDKVPPRPREALIRQIRGESLSEIAEAMGMKDAKAVDNLLTYARRCFKQERARFDHREVS